MGKAGLILFALMAAASAQAAWIPDSALLTAAQPAKIADLVRQMGRPALLERDEAGDPTIATGFAGYPARIWFFDCEADGSDCLGIRLQVGIGTVHKLTLAQVNGFNQEKRFATLSLDEEGDPILAHDISMVKPGISAAAFSDAFRVFDEQALALVEMVKMAEKAGRK
jgi:hypothetical protein